MLSDLMELKIPPVIVTLIFAALIWLTAIITPAFPLPWVLGTSLLLTLMISGTFIALAALRAFRKARTTVNPLQPESSSTLVCTGIFAHTRNPMYLALLFALLALCVYLENAFTLIPVVLFVLFMNRFQILPEERAMESLFGEEYLDYKARVRRWL